MFFRHWDSSVVRPYLKLVSDSTAEPLATTDIKRQVNLPSTYYGDDDWIDGAITAARLLIEQRTGGLSLIHKTYDLVLNRFPESNQAIELPYPPLSSISSITYYDASNSSTTLATSDYQSHTPTTQPGWIAPPNGGNGSWPSTYARPDAVTIRYVAGFGASGTSVPINIRHAMKMLVAHWYENREAINVGNITTELPLGVEALLAGSRWGHYG